MKYIFYIHFETETLLYPHVLCVKKNSRIFILFFIIIHTSAAASKSREAFINKNRILYGSCCMTLDIKRLKRDFTLSLMKNK